MSSLKQIRRRISSVKNTQKITKAMKMVSAAKLRRATEKAEASRPYEQELLSIIRSILQGKEWNSPLLEQSASSGRRVLFVFSSDRGLCGSLNSNIVKKIVRDPNVDPNQIEIVSLGKKAGGLLDRRGYNIIETFLDLQKEGSFELFMKLSQKYQKEFIEGKVDRVDLVFSEYKSALSQVPTMRPLLPFELPEFSEGQSGEIQDFIYEPKGEEMLEKLVPMLIDFQVYRAFLESSASEHAARMASMDAATKNARDMIDKLTLQMNRARQAAITKELMEIIGGAEAISA